MDIGKTLRASQLKMLAHKVARFSPCLCSPVICTSLFLHRIDVDRMFFRNNGTLLTDYTALYLEQK